MATQQANFQIPFALQQRLAQSARDRAAAEQQLQQAQNFTPPPPAGGFVTRIQPLQVLTQGLQAFLAGKQKRELDAQDQATAQEVTGLQAQQQKEALRRELVSTIVDKTATRSDPGSLRDAVLAQDPGKLKFFTPSLVPSTFNGSPILLGTDKEGEQRPFFPPREADKVIVTTGDKTDAVLDRSRIEALEKKRLEVEPLQNRARSAIRVFDLIDKGAAVGGGQSLFQLARKAAQAIGVNIPATGLTDAARAELGTGLIDIVRKFAPVAGNDVQTAERITGSVDTDPGALKELSALTIANSIFELQRFNKDVDRSAAVSSGDRQKFEAIKLELEDLSTKNPALAGRVFQLLQGSGADLRGFTFDGKPVQDLTFNIEFLPPLPPAPGTAPITNIPSRFKRVQ